MSFRKSQKLNSKLLQAYPRWNILTQEICTVNLHLVSICYIKAWAIENKINQHWTNSVIEDTYCSWLSSYASELQGVVYYRNMPR